MGLRKQLKTPPEGDIQGLPTDKTQFSVLSKIKY